MACGSALITSDQYYVEKNTFAGLIQSSSGCGQSAVRVGDKFGKSSTKNLRCKARVRRVTTLVAAVLD